MADTQNDLIPSLTTHLLCSADVEVGRIANIGADGIGVGAGAVVGVGASKMVGVGAGGVTAVAGRAEDIWEFSPNAGFPSLLSTAPAKTAPLSKEWS